MSVDLCRKAVSDGYRVYVPECEAVIVSRDVVFLDELTSVAGTNSVDEPQVDVEPLTEACDMEDCSGGQDISTPTLRDRSHVQLPLKLRTLLNVC